MLALAMGKDVVWWDSKKVKIMIWSRIRLIDGWYLQTGDARVVGKW